MARIIGTEGDDDLVAGNSGDLIKGLGGDDTISGGTGDDTAYGGAGNDVLWGGSGGADQLFGGGGDDTIDEGGHDGADFMDGGTGDDTLRMFYGTFIGGGIAAFEWSFDPSGDMVTPAGSTATGFERVDITGSDGDDTITGGARGDMVRGWQGSDRLFGGRGADLVIGDNGDDTLDGGLGGDRLDGGGGFDVLIGGKGDDTLVGGHVFDVFGGDDTLIGGAGADVLTGSNHGVTTISYADSSAGVQVDLPANTAHGGDAEGDSFGGAIGVFIGSAHDDSLSGAPTMDGGAGDDELVARYGTRLMVGGEGKDSFVIEFDKLVIYEQAHIADFDQAGGDIIDLSRIDARAKDGDQAFRFIGTDAFDGAPGEVRYEVVDGRTMIQMSLDQDADAEHTIWLDGVFSLTEADLVL